MRDEHMNTLQKVLPDLDSSIDLTGTVANESYENLGPDGGVLYPRRENTRQMKPEHVLDMIASPGRNDVSLPSAESDSQS